MRYIIAGLQLAQGPQGEGLIFIIGLLDLVFMITLEDLVIGIANYFKIMINESFMNGSGDRIKMDLRLQVFKNSMQALQLLGVFGNK